MASTPTSAISGVISGINYRDLIDQIIKAETAPADRLRAQASALSAQQTAIGTYKGLLQRLLDAARALRDGSAFTRASAATTVSAGSRALGTATASPFAEPGNYALEVTQLAQQQRLASTLATSASIPAGLAGTFTINGQSITVTASDTLADIRGRISALAAGADPIGVSATIVGAGTPQARLVLTSVEAGEAGMTLEDTSGTVLQSLGFLSGPATIDPAAVLAAGQSAQYSVDGVAFTSTSNVVTNAIEGVTLTLTAAEAGAVTTVTVSRSGDEARTAVQAFVDAYNAVMDFIREQQKTAAEGGSAPPLYGDNLLRVPRASLPQTLLSTIGGTSTDLSTAAMAGLSIDRSGKLTLNAARFDAAYTDRLADLQRLFQQSGTTTDPQTYYLTSTSRTPAGTYAIAITQAATQTAVAGSGLGGTFVDDGAGDTMTVTDTALGRSASITLTSGMTSTHIVDALNAAFGASGLGLLAREAGGEVSLSQGAWGSSAGITIAYTAGGTSGNVPIAAGTYADGLDVQGTINGEAATGSGQVLLASTGTTAEGLSVRYAGTATGLAGEVTVHLGTGSLLERMLQRYTDANSGILDSRTTALTERAATRTAKADRIEARLELRREQLLKQYASMEQALSRLQSQSSSLIASLNALLQGGGKE